MKRITGTSSLRRRIRAFTALWSVLQSVTALCLCLAFLILLDAVLILPALLRQWTWPILLTTLAATLFPGLRRLVRMNDFRAARWVEVRRPELGNLMSNAADFRHRQPASQVEGRLCRRAADKATELARGIRLWPLMRRTTRRIMAGTLGSLFILIAGGVMLQPIVVAVWPRLFDPHGDHPPYSRLQLTVTPGNARILYGGRLDVRVQASGRAVAQLNLVANTPRGSQVLPMFIAPDRSYFQSLTNITADTTYHVTDGRARSHRFFARVVHTPKIEAVQAQIRYPEYTRLPLRERSLGETPIEVPTGSQISFQVTSNRKLQGGEMIFTPVLGGAEQTISCEPVKSGRTVACDIEAKAAGLFKITVMDEDKRRSREAQNGRIDILADQPPRIQVLQPQRQVVATPDSVIPVAVESADDYGISRLLWFRGLNMSVETPGEIKLGTRSKPGFARAKTHIDLKDLGLRPGDVIHYFFESVDNDPKGPNLASSLMYSIEVISQATYEAILARRQAREEILTIYETLSRRLHRLIQKAEKSTPDSDPRSDEKKFPEAGLAEIMDLIGAYTQQLEATISQRHRFDIEALFKDHLATQKEALDQIVTDYQERKEREDFDPQAFRDGLIMRLKELHGRSEAVIMDPLRKIKSVIHILAMGKQFEALTDSQGNLVPLARRFAMDTQPLRLNRIHRLELQALGNKETDIAGRVATFFHTLRGRLKNLPDDPALDCLRRSVKDFLYRAGWLPIEEDLTTAAQNFAGLDGPQGYEKAMTALKNMEALLDVGEGILKTGRKGLLSLRLPGGTARQILDALGGGDIGFGRNGYSLYDERIALYGPGTLPLQEDNRSPDDVADRFGSFQDGAPKPGQEPDAVKTKSGKINILKDIPFPLRYRQRVGDYFRKVAEDYGTDF